MPYLYLIGAVFTNASSSVIGTYFNRRNDGKRGASPFYTFLQLCSVFFCWLVLFVFDLSWDWGVLPYALLFALFYTVCHIAIINALRNGPTTLTSLFIGLSLLITTAWGFAFWDAKFTLFVGLGLVLVVASVYLCLYNGKKDEKKISWKWILFVVLAMVCNSGCSITQRTQQMQFDGQYGNMLMAVATFFGTIASFLLWLKSDKADTKVMLKSSWYFPVGAGVFNLFLNLCVMKMALTTLSPSLIYPVIGVGGLMVVTLFSLFAFKEKLKWQQWLGIALGAVATALLSL